MAGSMELENRLRRSFQLLALCAGTISSTAAAEASESSMVDVCDTKIRIGGTVFNAKAPARSWALLYPAPNKRGGVYRQGMRVDVYRLVAIEPRGILLQGEEKLCWLRLAPEFEPPRARSRPEPARTPRARGRARRAAFTRAELESGVQMVQPRSYVVERSLVREALSRAPRIARATRTRLVGARDRPWGLQLRRLARDGLLVSLGLRRNDVVKTLNGFLLVTPEGVLGARAQVQQAQRLSLAIERNGTPLTLEYRVN
jgi:hypothetical protein